MSRRTLFAVVCAVLLASAAGLSAVHFGRLHSNSGSSTSAKPDCFHNLGGMPAGSYGQARKAATFPVLAPTKLPPGYPLVSIKEYGLAPPMKLPPGYPLVPIKDYGLAPRGGSKTVSPTFIESDYCDSAGHFLVITQGHTSFIATLIYQEAPEGSKGPVLVDGKRAYWVRGFPAPDYTPTTSPGARAWQPDFPLTALGWQSGADDLSPRYVSLASDTLDVDQLVAVAASLR